MKLKMFPHGNATHLLCDEERWCGWMDTSFVRRDMRLGLHQARVKYWPPGNRCLIDLAENRLIDLWRARWQSLQRWTWLWLMYKTIMTALLYIWTHTYDHFPKNNLSLLGWQFPWSCVVTRNRLRRPHITAISRECTTKGADDQPSPRVFPATAKNQEQSLKNTSSNSESIKRRIPQLSELRSFRVRFRFR